MAIRRPQNGRYGQVEALVAANLVANGFLVTRMPYNHPFDILLNESTRIEVKTSKKRRAGYWGFNIHRHGLLKEECDWYALHFEDLEKTIYLKAPVNRSTLQYTKKKLANPQLELPIIQ